METIIILLATVLLGVIAILSAYAVGVLDTKAGSVVVAFLVLFLSMTATNAMGLDVTFLTQSFIGWLSIGGMALAFSEGLRWLLLDEEIMLMPAPVTAVRYDSRAQVSGRRTVVGVRWGRFSFIFGMEVMKQCWA